MINTVAGDETVRCGTYVIEKQKERLKMSGNVLVNRLNDGPVICAEGFLLSWKEEGI